MISFYQMFEFIIWSNFVLFYHCINKKLNIATLKNIINNLVLIIFVIFITTFNLPLYHFTTLPLYHFTT